MDEGAPGIFGRLRAREGKMRGVVGRPGTLNRACWWRSWGRDDGDVRHEEHGGEDWKDVSQLDHTSSDGSMSPRGLDAFYADRPRAEDA